MNIPKPHIILPAEVAARELDAKILFALAAAERGYPVITGCHARINRAIHSLPRSIYIAKGITRRSRRMFRILDILGHALVAWDEEAIVYMNATFYKRRKLHDESMALCKALFAWGQDNAELWRSWEMYDGTPIHVTGNPRADLFRAPVREFFRDEADRLSKEFGRFILINSNFGRVNHFLSNLTQQFQDPAASDVSSVSATLRWTKKDPLLGAFRYKVLQHFLEVAPEIARRFPGHHLVVRPHPSENKTLWEEAVKDLPNVTVLNRGHVAPWLLAADAVLHNGCTTGLEAFLLGRPVIAYQPITDPDYDIQLPNEVSHVAGDREELFLSIDRAIKGGRLDNEDRSGMLRHFFASYDGDLACDRILDVLDEIAFTYAAPQAPQPAAWIKGTGLAVWRHLSKIRNAYREGHHNNMKYIRHRFPDIDLAEIEARAERFRTVLGRFEQVKVRQRAKNVFEFLPRG